MDNLTKILRVISICLLAATGLNALVAGWCLVVDPSGNTLGMSTVFLEDSPFKNFLVPGIILFVAIGVVSMLAAVFAFLRLLYYAKLIFFAGVVLTGWIIIQMILLQTLNFLQILFGSIGVLLVVFGIVLKEASRTNNVSH